MTIYVHHLVIDALPEWPAADCWRCGWSEDWPEDWQTRAAEPGYLLCGQCGLSMAPVHIVGRRRNYLSLAAARRHVDRIAALGGRAHVDTSDPVTFPVVDARTNTD